MANDITVKWLQVTELSKGVDNAKYSNLFDATKQKSTLDFGNVQAGKATEIKCVVANFNGANQVSDLQFWLDSTAAYESSTNRELDENGWNFYYCIVPKNSLNFSIEPGYIDDAQKIGGTRVNGEKAYLDANNTFFMKPIERSSNVSVDQFPPTTSSDTSQTITLTDSTAENGYRGNDSHLILLSVQTPEGARSGTTEGWYYRMNFLYH